jgi:hypothetical protein
MRRLVPSSIFFLVYEEKKFYDIGTKLFNCYIVKVLSTIRLVCDLTRRLSFNDFHIFLKELTKFVDEQLWQNIALREWMLCHQRNWRIWNPPNLIDRLFIRLICITKNTQVFNFSNGHFWPTPFPFLSNAPSLTLLIHCSLSLSPSISINPPLHFTCCNFK